jgi:tRNA nucleotidyltransferase (CCA-adding enzyme)
VARRGHAYPNIGVVASDLINTRLSSLPPRASAAGGLDRAMRLDVVVLAVVSRVPRAILREDLRRAVALGLGDVPATRVARALPVVDAQAGEVSVRRELAAGAPLVLVHDGTALVGAVAPTGASNLGAMGPSLAGRLAVLLDDEAQRLLRRIALLAEGQGSRAFAVGGVVRDAVAGEAGRGGRDLDVVVEGDGVAVARGLAAETGGELAVHPRFLTASVRAPGGRRVDVATARAEHYEAPGALPRVRPAGIGEDLARRDFTVNAMAAELSSGTFHLVDPLGGRGDLALRRLRVLHPLSFVEDPTRLFRAARYAVRLGLTLDPWTTACRRLALGRAPFDALSGARLTAELTRILDEPDPGRVLARLGTDGAFRLVARGYRNGPTTAERFAALAAAGRWARRHALPVAPLELLVLALLGDQAPRVAGEALDRLGVSGEPRSRLVAILRGAPGQLAGLRAAASRSAAARILRNHPGLEMAWLWLTGDGAVRRRVTRFAARDAAVRPWLDGDEVMALGIPQGPGVARVLGELRDGRLDGTLRDRAAARHHVRRRIGPHGATGGARTIGVKEG